MYGGKKRPHKKRYNEIVMSRVKPHRIEHQLHYHRNGQGVAEIKDLEGHLIYDQSGDNEGENGDEPRNALRDVGDDAAVVFCALGHFSILLSLMPFLAMILGYEVIKGHAEKLGDLGKNGYIGGGLCPLPFRYGFIRII